MGKKDLLKSTTKKKKNQKKVGADEKATQKKMPAKKAAPSKKLTGTALLLQKFDSWKPATLFTVELNQEDEKNFTSPPFFTDLSKQKMDAIHQLLSLKFDIQKIIEKGGKAAAEKAAAEKAAAEKAAAEKAAAEKAAAEKAAAEKAAVEKAAAEKAAAEKAAAEKAAAEKAAAEKAAAEKAAAEKIESVKTTKTIPNVACTEEKTEPDPSRKMLVIIAACLAFIFTPIILASFLNTTNYYLQVSDGALELWQGEFAPLGKNIVISMPGALPPETIKEVYCKKEVFPIVSGYLLDKADTLIEIEGLSNFQHIKSTLQEAQTYAVTKPMQIKIDNRLTRIEFMNLMYKADVAADSSSSEGKENAIHYLEKAALLDLTVHETEMVKKKLSALQGEQQK